MSHQTVWWTLVPPSSCAVHMYTLCASQVAVVCTYVHITCTCTCIASLRPKKGTRTVPFLRIPAGIVISSTGRRSPMYKVYIVPGGTTGAPHFGQQRGPERSPFLTSPAGLLTSSTWPRNKIASLGIFGPRVHSIVNIFQDHLWLVIVILKSLNLVVSCIPVLYYVYLHMFYAF